MASALPRPLLQLRYDRAAYDYSRSLPLEHFMESIHQSTQRKITLESLDLVAARRPDFRVFSELLVQYPRPGEKRIGQVVPDNMVVLTDKPIQAEGSYNLPFEPARPYWVLEYVSRGTMRKDYEDNLTKYEQELKVPYYLVFYPDIQEMTLYRLKQAKYVSAKPNRQGRCTIRKLEMQVGLLDGWVRFWYQGELLPLPADLQRDLDEARRQVQRERRRADEAIRRAEEAAHRADEFQRSLEREQDARRALEQELAQLRAATGQPPRRANGPKV